MMRLICKSFLILAFCSAWMSVQAQDAATNLRYTYKNISVSRNKGGQTVTIAFDVLPTSPIESKEHIIISPEYISKDMHTRVALAPIHFAGANRYKILKRKHRLGTVNPLEKCDPKKIITLSDKKKMEATRVEQTIPYQVWMKDANLYIKEQTYGCATCDLGENEGFFPLSAGPRFTKENYAYDFLTPQKTEIKRYAERLDCKVNFMVGRHELVTDFQDNAHELRKLKQFMERALKLAKSGLGATLDQMEVVGYASPESPADYNQKLSERRAAVLAEYVRNIYPEVRRIASSSVEGAGEDWVGLRKLVEASHVEDKDMVLSAIDSYTTDTDREAQIKSLRNGSVYQFLLTNLYPALRRTTFSMGYEVRPYTVQELPGIFEKNPALMSHYELSQLIDIWIKEGKNPTKIYGEAYKLYKEDPIAVLNYANALLKYENNAAKALEVLAELSGDLRAEYPKAVALHMQGDEDAADAVIESAAQRGDKRAMQVWQNNK